MGESILWWTSAVVQLGACAVFIWCWATIPRRQPHNMSQRWVYLWIAALFLVCAVVNVGRTQGWMPVRYAFLLLVGALLTFLVGIVAGFASMARRRSGSPR